MMPDTTGLVLLPVFMWVMAAKALGRKKVHYIPSAKDQADRRAKTNGV